MLPLNGLVIDRDLNKQGSSQMRKFLGTIVLIAVVVAAIGFYSGWLSFSNKNDPNSSDFGVEVNRNQMMDDAKKGVDDVGDAFQKGEDAIKGATQGK